MIVAFRFPSDITKNRPLSQAIKLHESLNSTVHDKYKTLFFSQIDKEKMLSSLSPSMLSTDLAYYLVRKGVNIRLLVLRFITSFYNGNCSTVLCLHSLMQTRGHF